MHPSIRTAAYIRSLNFISSASWQHYTRSRYPFHKRNSSWQEHPRCSCDAGKVKLKRASVVASIQHSRSPTLTSISANSTRTGVCIYPSPSCPFLILFHPPWSVRLLAVRCFILGCDVSTYRHSHRYAPCSHSLLRITSPSHKTDACWRVGEYFLPQQQWPQRCIHSMTFVLVLVLLLWRSLRNEWANEPVDAFFILLCPFPLS